jgi:transposase InsO family protein
VRAEGIAVGRHRVAKLLRNEGLRAKAKRRYRVTTDSNHLYPISPNRVARKFHAERPNQVWLSDITYLPTSEGWLYLSCFLDLYSRRIVGWSLDDTLEASATCRALAHATALRAPQAGLIIHSDRGVQYAGGDFQRLLKRSHFVSSMSRKGNCWDNAPMESFFATLKREIDTQKPWATRASAETEIASYIAYYNQERRHSILDYLSPLEYELKNSI